MHKKRYRRAEAARVGEKNDGELVECERNFPKVRKC